MLSGNDTITAIATATGAAGIGVVRLSGPNALTVVAKVARTKVAPSRQKSHTLRRALVFDPTTGDEIDDVLLAVFHAPNSFTGENVAEIQGHGGSVTLSRILSACLSAGARLARPGEFTERAFLKGKMDLTQAEAVSAMISAQTVAAQRAARRQLSGELRRAVEAIGDTLKDALARIEASIDFPEDVGEIDPEVVGERLTTAQAQIASLLATAKYGERLTGGVTLAIAGRPNVGKSSLLNALSGRDRSIVTAIAGTTRDIVEESLNIGGIPVRALDTAGIRETDDVVERIGVERAKTAVADADVVIAVLDATAGVSEDEVRFLQSLAGRPFVVAINKADAADANGIRNTLTVDAPVLSTATANGQGLPELVQALSGLLGATDNTMPLVTQARHTSALTKAQTALADATQTLENGLPAELIAVDVHGALQTLGEITGETAREEIIAGIFSRFCIGK